MVTAHGYDIIIVSLGRFVLFPLWNRVNKGILLQDFYAESIVHTIPIIDSGNVFRFLLKPKKLSDGIDVLLITVYRREKTKASLPAHLFKTGHY